jgi:hypothetical protein
VEDNIKIVLVNGVRVRGLDSSGSNLEQVAGCFKFYNEASISINCGECIE